MKTILIILVASFCAITVNANTSSNPECDIELSNSGPAYQLQSSLIKQNSLWASVASETYAELPPMTFLPPGLTRWQKAKAIGGAIRSGSQLNRAFDRGSDEIRAGREKVIHSWGSVAKIEFQAAAGNPFTGLFQSGALGVARMSLALPQESVHKFVPGLAVKLFVDGQPSKNFEVMERLEGQDQDHNYFAETFTNRLPKPTETATKVGTFVFQIFVQDAIDLKQDHLAGVTSSGEAVENPKAPFQIFLVPNVTTDSNAPDFRTELAKIPAGTVLYNMYGTISADDPTRYFIGTIRTTSEIVASEYGDKVLYFQHEGATLRWLFNRWPFTR